MNSKYRAYALIEVLIIIAALVVLIAAAITPMREIITEIPRSNKLYQTWNTNLKVLELLKQDVEQSGEIVSLKDGILKLRYQGRIVEYSFSDGWITRQGISEHSKSTWNLPHMKYDARLWTKDNRSVALEITAYNQQSVLGKEQIRLKQSNVYFQKDRNQSK